MKKNEKNGFTLIEIIIAIFIIGIIITLANISINKIKEKGRDIKRIDNIEQLQLALEMYRRDVGSYPETLVFGEKLTNPSNPSIVYLNKIPNNLPYKNNENCPNEEYFYSKENKFYFINFCLESPIKNYALGYNCANNEGIKSERCFQCGMPITYESQNYNTVAIENQCWLAENLNIGTMISGVSEHIDQTNNEIIEKYCCGNDENYCDTYGGLYQWNEAMQYLSGENTQGICPVGWHLPSVTDWTTLITNLGGDLVAGGEMKAAAPIWDGTNSSGFTAIPAGWLPTGGKFMIDGTTRFWSSSEYNSNNSWSYYLKNDPNIYSYNINKFYGLSVRCLKN